MVQTASGILKGRRSRHGPTLLFSAILGECSALWGKREGVYGALVFRSPTFSHLQAPHITVSFPVLPTFNICLWNELKRERPGEEDRLSNVCVPRNLGICAILRLRRQPRNCVTRVHTCAQSQDLHATVRPTASSQNGRHP